MHRSFRSRTNIILIMTIAAVLCIAATVGAFAASVPKAKGVVISDDGAVLRKSSSTASRKLVVLSSGAGVTIHKEVFKKKKSTADKNKWYYVSAAGQKGYVRADLVGNINYGSVSGKLRTKANYRKGAGTKMKKIGSLKKKSVVTVCLTANPVSSTKGSSKKWYKIKAGPNYYYVCSSNIKLGGDAVAADPAAPSYASYVNTPMANMTDAQFASYLKDQGFPESYKKKLTALHKKHPNWGFVGYKTNIKWSTALDKQAGGSKNLIAASQPKKYRSGSSQPEKGWYVANSQVVAYYMDPRNFLNEDRIYMFEDLSYKPQYQTAASVSAILSNSRLPACGFGANIFIDAAAATNVSPVFLAARAVQENGNGGDAVNGSTVFGNVYNPFNIGANGGTNPLYNGLVYAAAKGWNTPGKAVAGGASLLAENYVKEGQYTGYYQRFNVRNGVKKIGTHQYMTNVQAPYSEAGQTAGSYKKYGISNQALVFEIPVFESMPSSTKLP